MLVVAAGCLDPLVALLNDGDARVAEEAAGCLWSLAIDDRSRSLMDATAAELKEEKTMAEELIAAM